MESANERVLNLMDKHAKKSVIQNNLHQAAKAGIWNHVMAFYGFPGETRDEALETRQFVIDNQPVIHSVELFYFVAYRHTPMVRNPGEVRHHDPQAGGVRPAAGLLLHAERAGGDFLSRCDATLRRVLSERFSALGRPRERPRARVPLHLEVRDEQAAADLCAAADGRRRPTACQDW